MCSEWGKKLSVSTRGRRVGVLQTEFESVSKDFVHHKLFVFKHIC